MGPTPRLIRTFTMTVAIALAATVASPQSAGEVQATPGEGHAHGQPAQAPGGDRPMAKMHQDMMAGMAAMDERAHMLVAEMHSFIGEPKVAAMAELLALLVERQSMMREHMVRMHEHMMGHMMDLMSAAPADVEPGMMCAPTEDGR